MFALLPNISFANERFIPVELWSGGEITGAQEITFPETDFNFGYKKRHSIRGPINWEILETAKSFRFMIVRGIAKKREKQCNNFGQ